MQGKEKQLFREEALERLSSPERLDQLMNVVNPKAWIPLATLGGLTFVAALWSVFGRLPLTVSGQGILIYPRSVISFQAPGEGDILKLNIKPGQEVKKGDVLGIINQPNLEKQLQQKRNQLLELLQQNKNTNQAEQKRLRLQRQDLEQQRANLEKSLERESIVPILRQKNLDLLAKNRSDLEKRLSNSQEIVPKLREKNLLVLKEKKEKTQARLAEINTLLPKLRSRVESLNRLLESQLITGDALLNAEREYLDSLAQLADIEAQQKELELQETDTERQYLESLNQIDEIKSKIQEIDVREADMQRQYLQSLNQVDELKSKIEQVDSQKAKLAQEELEGYINRTNRIQEVKREIAQLEQQLANKSRIVSEYNGQVLEVSAVPGQIVSAGTRLGTISAEVSSAKLISISYFADKDGKQIQPGMEVQVTPSLVKRERYGGIVGKVTQVSPFPVTVEEMATIMGSQSLAESFVEKIARISGSKAPVQVFAQLETDPNTISGYKWSSSDGPALKLSSGTTTQVRVKVGEVAPISYVIPLFRSLTGVY